MTKKITIGRFISLVREQLHLGFKSEHQVLGVESHIMKVPCQYILPF